MTRLVQSTTGLLCTFDCPACARLKAWLPHMAKSLRTWQQTICTTILCNHCGLNCRFLENSTAQHGRHNTQAGFGDGSARTVKTRIALSGVLFVQPFTNNGQAPITMHQPFGIYIKIHLCDQARGKSERVSKRKNLKIKTLKTYKFHANNLVERIILYTFAI